MLLQRPGCRLKKIAKLYTDTKKRRRYDVDGLIRLRTGSMVLQHAPQITGFAEILTANRLLKDSGIG